MCVVCVCVCVCLCTKMSILVKFCGGMGCPKDQDVGGDANDDDLDPGIV